MACLYYTTFLVILSIMKGASAGNVTTGSACAVTSDCADTTNNVCVPTTLKCLIMPTKTCSTSEDKCVTGATCSGTTPTCSCDTTKHIAATPTDYCRLKVDQACSTSTTSPTAPCLDNGECVPSTCKCKTSYVASTDKTSCILKAGQTGCTADEQCTANSECTSGKCTCSTNYVEQGSGLCLLKSGQTCTSDSQCTANSACSSGTTRTCTCSTNYVAQTSGLCLPKENANGGSCTIVNSVDSCVTTGLDPNAVCSGGTCGCKSGYTATVGAKCLLKSGQTCTSDSQCTANSACSSGKCTCSTNYVEQGSGLCSPNDNAYGGSCTIVGSVDSCVTTSSDPNAVCSAVTGGTCGCKSGYTATVGAKCSISAGAMNFAGSVFLLVAALILTSYLQ